MLAIVFWESWFLLLLRTTELSRKNGSHFPGICLPHCSHVSHLQLHFHRMLGLWSCCWLWLSSAVMFPALWGRILFLPCLFAQHRVDSVCCFFYKFQSLYSWVSSVSGWCWLLDIPCFPQQPLLPSAAFLVMGCKCVVGWVSWSVFVLWLFCCTV